MTATPLFDSPYFRLEQVADGIYAAIVVGGTGAWGNAAIVDLGQQTLVFDTFFTPQAARSLRAAAETVTGRPVSYVVNSHRHADHVFGNQLFPEALIIATRDTRDLMASRSQGMLEYMRANPDYPDTLEAEIEQATDPGTRHDLTLYLGELRALQQELHSLTLRLPDITFERELHFHGTRRQAQLLCLGGGHTPSDAILYLPDDGIALVADLGPVGFHPSIDGGDPDDWRRILAHLQTLPLTAVVPGHGPVGTLDDLARLHDYLAQLERLAAEAVAAGQSAEDFAATPPPAPYAAWEVSSEFPANLHFFYERAKGDEPTK